MKSTRILNTEVDANICDETGILHTVERRPSGRLVGYFGFYATIVVDGVMYRGEKLDAKISFKKMNPIPAKK